MIGCICAVCCTEVRPASTALVNEMVFCDSFPRSGLSTADSGWCRGVVVVVVVVVVVGMKLAAFHSVLHCRIHALLSARSKLERDFAGYFYPA